MDPLVSVVIPLFNYARYVSDCIKSIQQQEYSNWEIIVVDDCSTDRSLEVAKRSECSNIKVIQLDCNSGYSRAKNEGIIASNGDLITCLDADDMLTRNSLLPRVNAIRDSSKPFVHARALTVRGDLTLEDCQKLTRIDRQNPRIHAQTVLVERWVHQKFGLYDEDLKSRADKEMWWRLFDQNDKGEQKIQRHFIKNDVAFYRIHKRSMMAYRRKDQAYDDKMTRILYAKFEMRKKQGITTENTRFLD